MKISLEVVEVRGAAHELGRQQGEHLRARISNFIATRKAAVRNYAAERGRTGPGAGDAVLAELLSIGAKSQQIQAKWDPQGHEEHLGIAAGANVDAIELYTFTNMTDMRDALLLGGRAGEGATPADAEGCTSALIPPTFAATGTPLAGQTWDLNPTDVEFVVAVVRNPTRGLRTFSLTCGGCLTLVGMNERGLAVGTTNIKIWGSRPGVGYLDVLHRAIRCESVQEASPWVRDAPRAGAHTYWLADPWSQVEWECAPEAAVMRTTEAGPIGRSNHCLVPEFAARQGEVTSTSSKARLARINELLSAGNATAETLRAAFADRSQGVDSINRYPEDNQGTATNGVFIADPVGRRLWACRGPADRGEWLEFAF
jgi:isopenicillin-N N-acyltransferase-like protein